MKKLSMFLLSFLILAFIAVPSFAADNAKNAPATQSSSSTSTQAKPDVKPGSSAQSDTQSPMGPQRLSMILGSNVKSVNADNLGKVEDAVIDKNGKITYLILSHGGFLGIGDKLVPIPWDAVARHGNLTMDRNYLVVDMGKDFLEKAPNFETKSWPNLSEGDWTGRIKDYFSSWSGDGANRNRAYDNATHSGDQKNVSSTPGTMSDRNYSKDSNFSQSTGTPQSTDAATRNPGSSTSSSPGTNR